MSEPHKTDVDSGTVSRWLALAASNGAKCFICGRIAEANRPEAGEIRPIRISGIELGIETQVNHLAICVGRTPASA